MKFNFEISSKLSGRYNENVMQIQKLNRHSDHALVLEMIEQ